jgi:hypothetical protein
MYRRSKACANVARAGTSSNSQRFEQGASKTHKAPGASESNTGAVPSNGAITRRYYRLQLAAKRSFAVRTGFSGLDCLALIWAFPATSICFLAVCAAALEGRFWPRAACSPMVSAWLN